MSRFAPKTLRRMPPTSREIARLANELASVQTRLANRVERLTSMEMMAGASLRVFCNDGAHANVVNAALSYVQSVGRPGDARQRQKGRAELAQERGRAPGLRQAVR